jgi:arsenate reductase
MKTTIYHNPRCSKSREVLQLLRDRGIEPEIIDYLAQPPSPWRLHEIIARLGLRPRDLVRTKEPVFATLGLDLGDDAAVTAALSAHPELIERPIVLHGDAAVLARPPQRALEILD